MKKRSTLALAGSAAVACIVTLAMGVGPAYAGAEQVPVNQYSQWFMPIGAPPPVMPGVTFSPSCPTVLQTASAAFEFVDGSGHFYGPANHPLTSGGNFEGTAYFLGFSSPTYDPSSLVYAYFGTGHLWFGQSNVPASDGSGPPASSNAQVSAQTAMFHGVNTDGSGTTLDVQASFGSTQSASGHQADWIHLKVTCL